MLENLGLYGHSLYRTCAPLALDRVSEQGPDPELIPCVHGNPSGGEVAPGGKVEGHKSEAETKGLDKSLRWSKCDWIGVDGRMSAGIVVH